jgi:hypothetical protein
MDFGVIFATSVEVKFNYDAAFLFLRLPLPFFVLACVVAFRLCSQFNLLCTREFMISTIWRCKEVHICVGDRTFHASSISFDASSSSSGVRKRAKSNCMTKSADDLMNGLRLSAWTGRLTASDEVTDADVSRPPAE